MARSVKPTPSDRFMAQVTKLGNGCWLWTGSRSRGKGNRMWYGSFRDGNKVWRAHAWAHDVLAGKKIENGQHRDHTCCLSLCVNPDHIEAVSRGENQRRKIDRKRKSILSSVVFVPHMTGRVEVPYAANFL